MSLVCLLLALFAGFLSCGARECSSPVTQPVAQTRYESITSTYSYGCGFLWLGRCRRTRVRTIPVQVYQIQTVAVNTECCDGYTRNSDDGACSPVCSGGCATSQYCIAPNTCTCIDDGYTGDNCDQPICINCGQPRLCVAPATCQCERGFTGPDCEDDINECEAMDNAGCEQICINHHGSFVCDCEDGFSLGLDRGRCVGSVNLTLVTVDSSSLMATWHFPVWDSEKLTTAYNLTCSNDTDTVSAVILNNTNSTASDTISELMMGLDTDGGYQCCVTVLTLNGAGPPSCTVVPERVTTMATPSPTSSNQDMQQEGVTDARKGTSIVDSIVFQAGVGAGAAGLAFLFALCAMIICCTLCARCRRKKKEVPTTHTKLPLTDPTAEERDLPNAIYGMEELKKPLNVDTNDEDGGKDGLEYNNVYNGGSQVVENEYANVGETAHYSPQYHYVRY